MTEQGKTLGQLNVQPGDVVRCVNDGGSSWWTVGKEYHVYESEDGLIIKDDDDARWLNTSALFTIVSRNEVNPSQDGASIPSADPAPVAWPDGVQRAMQDAYNQGLRKGAETLRSMQATEGVLCQRTMDLAATVLEDIAARAALLIATANHVEASK